MVIKFAAQLFFVVAVSVGGYFAFGHSTYMVIGAVIAITVLALFMWRLDERVAPLPAEAEPVLSAIALEFFYRLMLALLLGVVWPSLPFIVGYGRAKDGAAPKSADPIPPQPR